MLSLVLLPHKVGICKLAISACLPSWIDKSREFFSITKTNNELSIVAIENAIPKNIKAERGWSVIMVEGPLDFSLTGILASIVTPLAQAKISVFAISTYNTDYILIKEESITKAITLLRQFCCVISANTS